MSGADRTGRGRRVWLLPALLATLGTAVPAAESAGARQPWSRLTIDAQPASARVYLDGIDQGNVPVDIPQRDTLIHLLRVEDPWCRPWVSPVKFDPGTDGRVTAILRRKEGMLTVATDPPGAAITVNDSAAGVSPLMLARQPAGEYRLTAELAGYRRARSVIVIDDERQYGWAPALEPAAGRIAFTGGPEGAEIRHRGRTIGTVPMVWDGLKQGSYHVEVQRPGFESAVVRAYADPDSPAIVDIGLAPTRAWRAVRKSLLVPGSGQHYRGNVKRGLLLKGAWYAALAMAAVAFNDREQKCQKFNEAAWNYSSATENCDQLYLEVERTNRRASNANRRLNIVLAATAVLYGANLVDAAVSAPNRRQFKRQRGDAGGQ